MPLNLPRQAEILQALSTRRVQSRLSPILTEFQEGSDPPWRIRRKVAGVIVKLGVIVELDDEVAYRRVSFSSRIPGQRRREWRDTRDISGTPGLYLLVALLDHLLEKAPQTYEFLRPAHDFYIAALLLKKPHLRYQPALDTAEAQGDSDSNSNQDREQPS